MMIDDLPEGWTVATLAQVGEWGSGGTPLRSRRDYYDDGTIPWLKIGDLTDGSVGSSEERITRVGLENSAARLLPPETLLVAMYGSIGKLGVSKIECATNQAIAYCKPRIDLWYLFWALRQSRQALNDLGKGGTQANISQTVLKDFAIPLAPLAEQRRIVEKVEELLARVNAARDRLTKVQAIMGRFRQSVLAAAFSGRLTEDFRATLAPSGSRSVAELQTTRRTAWERDAARTRVAAERLGARPGRLAYKEPVDIDDIETLPNLPESWCWASLDSLTTKIVDGVHHTPSYVEDGIPFVTVRHLTAGPEIDIRCGNFISPADHELFSLRTDPRSGDLLISKDGTLGVVRAVRTDAVFSIFVSVAMARPVTTELTDYLELALRAPQVQARMVHTGSGLQHLHLRDLKRVPVPLPPADEAREIVRRVRHILRDADIIGARTLAAVRHTEKLTQAILAKAFGGELVATEAALAREEGRGYETAEELLGRISLKTRGFIARKDPPTVSGRSARRGRS